MKERPRSWWQVVRKHWIISTIVLITVLGLFIFAAYRLSWDWTGFGAETSEPKQHAKTLWDWLQLLAALAIPVVVALGAAWFTMQQGKVNDRENTDNQREAALQSYIDKMSELLLEKELRESAEGDEIRQIARIRTLTVLRRLDAERKGNVLQFLNEAKLIDKDTCIVNLHGADFSKANLINTRAENANLSGANLRGANLSGANLRGTDLTRAILLGADLSKSNLTKATLGGAILLGADLFGADLSEAALSRADLSGATVTKKQLATVQSLEGAIMPYGKIYSNQFLSTPPTPDK